MKSTQGEYDGCFACGSKNPIGLRLKFDKRGEKAYTEFCAGSEHQGYQGMMHGGLVTTLIDEAMAYCMQFKEIKAVTGKLELRFRHPVPIGEKLVIGAGVLEERKKWVRLWGKIEHGDSLLAEGEGLFFKVNKD